MVVSVAWRDKNMVTSVNWNLSNSQRLKKKANRISWKEIKIENEHQMILKYKKKKTFWLVLSYASC